MTTSAKSPATAPSPSIGVMVAGMHRSGTSAMARALGLAGGTMPDRLINPAADNPLGFWEPQDMVALNDEMLAAVGSTWNDAFGFRAAQLTEKHHEAFVPRARSVIATNYPGASLAVAKDPRISLLAPVWDEAMTAEGLTPTFVIMVRDPMEVALSIAARDNAPVQASMLSWLSHMVAIERDTRDRARVFVSYDALIGNWEAVFDTVRTHLRIELPVSKDQAAGISGFLSRSERHHTTDAASWTDRSDLWPGIAEAWAWLGSATRTGGPETPFPHQIVQDLIGLEAQFGPVLRTQRTQSDTRERLLQSVIADREVTALRLRAQIREHESVIAESAHALANANEKTARAEVEVVAAHAESQRREADARTARAASLEAHARNREALSQSKARQEQLDQALAEASADKAQLEAELAAITARLETDLAAHGQRHEAELSATAATFEAQLAAMRARLDTQLADAGRQADQLREDLASAVSTATEYRRQAADLADQVQELTQSAARDQATIGDIEARLEALAAERDSVGRKLESVLASPSWSLTKPIRVVSKRMRAMTTRR